MNSYLSVFFSISHCCIPSSVFVVSVVSYDFFCIPTFPHILKAHWLSSSAGSCRNQTVWETVEDSSSCQPASLMQDITSLHPHASYSSCTISVWGHYTVTLFLLNPTIISASTRVSNNQSLQMIPLSVNSVCQPLESSNAVVYQVKNHLMSSLNPCSTMGPLGKS